MDDAPEICMALFQHQQASVYFPTLLHGLSTARWLLARPKRKCTVQQPAAALRNEEGFAVTLFSNWSNT
jgi:hypothetical protein